MKKRKISSVLKARLSSYSAVALLGPRQSGKTTLAKSLKGKYYDLEQETDRLKHIFSILIYKTKKST